MNDTVPVTFVVGSPLSGTTRLRPMLDAHPELAVAPESDLLVDALSRWGRPGTLAGFDRGGVVRGIEAGRDGGVWGLDDADRDAIARDDSLDSVPATVRAVYDRFAAGRGARCSIDVTARLTEHVELIDRAFPDCRFLHLVRDGRDVVPRLRESPSRPSGFADAALYWRSRAMLGRGARAVVGADRFHELRYEDLVVDPERSLEALCAFLDVDYSSLMLDYPNRAESVISGMGNRSYHENIGSAPKRTRDWRSSMSARDAARFEALAGDALAMFGYERGPNASIPLRAEAAARHAWDTVGKRARILRTRVRRRLGRG